MKYWISLSIIFLIGTIINWAWAVSTLDGSWRLVAIDSKPLAPMPASRVPFFVINGDGKEVSGFDGCNDFSGRIDNPGGIMTTRIGCPESAIKLPLDLGSFLNHLRSGIILENTISIPAAGLYPASIFERYQPE